MTISPDHAEAIPFTRANLAAVIGVPSSKVGNWIDRNVLWDTAHSHGYYTLSQVFDLGGFSALRTAHVPEKDCARFVREQGFYGTFLSGGQVIRLSFADDEWNVGHFDPAALVSITINVRTLGHEIFNRIAHLTATQPRDWPIDGFFSFRDFFKKAVSHDRMDENAVPLFRR